jgi:glycosyltransferase involved in cell wall biosynthesis
MNVAFVTETFPPEANGAAMTAARLVDGLAARDHRVQVVRPRPAVAEPAVTPPGRSEVQVAGVPLPFYRGVQFGRPCTSTLVRLWSHARPDLVHIVTEGPLGWSALQAARRLALPVTSGFHTNFHTYMGFYGLRWLRAAAVGYLRHFHNASAATLVPTTQTRDELRRVGFRNVAVVARGVDTRLYSPARRRPALRAQWGAGAGPVALVVGRVAREKHLELAVGAFHALRCEQPDAKLVIVGDGPLRPELQRRHRDFIFTGTLRGEELAAHYASADVFLFPSLTETFGNVVLEAMASGLAVVAFDDAAAREHIVDGENGLTATAPDADAFVRRALELARDAQRTARLGAAARESTLAIGWDKIGAQFERVLVRVAAGQPLVDVEPPPVVAPITRRPGRPRTQPA